MDDTQLEMNFVLRKLNPPVDSITFKWCGKK